MVRSVPVSAASRAASCPLGTPTSRARPLPDPIGTMPSAARLCVRADATSLIVPSPPHATTTSASASSASRASVLACPGPAVSPPGRRRGAGPASSRSARRPPQAAGAARRTGSRIGDDHDPRTIHRFAVKYSRTGMQALLEEPAPREREIRRGVCPRGTPGPRRPAGSPGAAGPCVGGRVPPARRGGAGLLARRARRICRRRVVRRTAAQARAATRGAGWQGPSSRQRCWCRPSSANSTA